MTKVTIVEVAQRSGVSISTVSRYLKDPQSINPVSAAKIAQAIKELNYIPNSFARNLKRGNARQIGVVVPDISQYLFAQSIKSLGDVLYQHGYLLMVCNSDYLPEKERFVCDQLVEQNIAGLVIATTGKNGDYLRMLQQKCPNIVLFEREESGVRLDCVTEDNEEKAYQLTRHLIQKGARRIAILGGLPYGYVTHIRTVGICRAAQEAGLPLEEEDIFLNTMTTAAAEAHMRTLLGRGRYDTILYTNPSTLYGIRNTLEKRGLRPGKDILLGGWSSPEVVHDQSIDFPCVLQKAPTVGAVAADLILQRVTGDEPIAAPRRVVVKTDLYLP